MKNLEIMGVQEMDAVEMRNVDGGHPLLVIASLAFTYIIIEAALNPQASADAFKEGQEMYRQEHSE
ncbi:MAG: hypothetical protein K9G70_13205 [Prolixibacteraceae bacterium]|nr:hypothetical protein [Prolixibacteraceae bacterium]